MVQDHFAHAHGWVWTWRSCKSGAALTMMAAHKQSRLGFYAPAHGFVRRISSLAGGCNRELQDFADGLLLLGLEVVFGAAVSPVARQ